VKQSFQLLYSAFPFPYSLGGLGGGCNIRRELFCYHWVDGFAGFFELQLQIFHLTHQFHFFVAVVCMLHKKNLKGKNFGNIGEL
jgi:hypothetical protein